MYNNRGAAIIDIARPFKFKKEDGTEVELHRIYNFILPLNAPWEEVFSAIEELTEDCKKIKAEGERIEAERKAKEEADKKAKETSLKEEKDLADELAKN